MMTGASGDREVSTRRLLVMDVEGTIFSSSVRLPGTNLASTIWQAIANALGPGAVAEEIETHRRWERGEYPTYIAWMRDTIDVHRRYGLERTTFLSLIEQAEYLPNAVQVLCGIDRSAYEPVLVSGGFRELARRAQLDCNIEHAFAACEYIFDRDLRLAGWNLLPCDFLGKLDFVRLLLKDYKLNADRWIYVGDGANDVPIARAAPVSIGIRPHPELAAVVDHKVESFSEIAILLDEMMSQRQPI
jgi:phosphoserine phosphatase